MVYQAVTFEEIMILKVIDNIFKLPMSLVVVFFIYWFNKPIFEILSATASFISRLKDISYGNLVAKALDNPNVSEDIKKALTENYSLELINNNNHVSRALDCLFLATESVRKLKKEVIDRVKPASLKDAIINLRKLKNSLLPFNKELEFEIKIKMLELLIQEISKAPQDIATDSWPIIDGLFVLDQNWRDKDPEKYLELDNLMTLLLKKI